MSDGNICEAYWTRCSRTSAKLVVFTNVGNGDLTTLRLCTRHAEQFEGEDFRRGLLDGALDTLGVLRNAGLSKMPMRDLLAHPSQVALSEHQRSCSRCREVRDWIIRQQQAGKIRSREDIERIGQYVIDNSCPEGIELNHAVGLAMQGQ